MDFSPELQFVTAEDKIEYSRLDKKHPKNLYGGKFKIPLLLMLAALVFFILIFVILAIVTYQNGIMIKNEKLLADLKSDLNSFESEVQKQMQESSDTHNKTSVEMANDFSRLSSSVESLSSSFTDFQDRMWKKMDASLTQLELSVHTLPHILEDMEVKFRRVVMAQLLDLRAKLRNHNRGVCDSDWVQFRSKCYFLSTDKLSWHQARDYCRNQNGTLVKLETGDEWEFVADINQDGYNWVGLTDENTGVWRWEDETPYVMNKDQWEENQPDDWKEHGLGEEGEDCANLTPYRKLNDSHCSEKYYYICEIRI